MIRRNARLRKEYIYRKSLEGTEREVFEKKRKIKQALNDGTELPDNLKEDFHELKHVIDLEDAVTSAGNIDDEYNKAGVEDPKVLLTTSRDPSSTVKEFLKELKMVFPNSQRINRGNTEIKELVESCRLNDVSDLILVHEHRGVPDGLIVCHLPYGPTAYFGLSNVVMRHDITAENLPNASEAYPHLIFNAFESRLGKRCVSILKYLFPVPKEDSRRVMTFSNENDFISFRYEFFSNEIELVGITLLKKALKLNFLK